MRVVHFEVPADDPARCMGFYERAFGWKFDKWEGPMPYWTIRTGEGPGIDGGLAPPQQPGQVPTNVVAVDSIDTATKSILAAGGSQTVPRMGIPGVGWCAYFLDTERNAFGIIQFDPAAA